MLRHCFIPASEAPDFSALRDDVKAEILAWLKAMQELLRVGKRGIGKAIRQQAAQMMVSEQTVRLKYDKFRKQPSWKVFINLAKVPKVRDEYIGLPPEFVEKVWKRLCEENQRKCKPAHRKLMRIYRAAQAAGETLPGYAKLPPETEYGYPHGWSYENLMRQRPGDFQLEAMREGLGAAIAKHGPKVLSTRVGLWPGAFIQVDDLTRDFKVLMLGKQSVARIQELGWLDVASGDRFLIHRRPQWEDNGKKNSLKEAEMRFTVAAFVRNCGYSPRGTCILSEHARRRFGRRCKPFSCGIATAS